jgi:hypothetical protein
MSALEGLLGITPKVTTSEARLGLARVERGVEAVRGRWEWTIESDRIPIASIDQWDDLLVEVANRQKGHRAERIAYRASLTSSRDGQTRAAYFPEWSPTT